MKLQAKIYEHNLDSILRGDKDVEFRQFESITLTDGERSATFKVKGVFRVLPFQMREIMDKHPDVPWMDDTPVHGIEIGELITTTEDKDHYTHHVRLGSPIVSTKTKTEETE